jgi:hypothetical protein
VLPQCYQLKANGVQSLPGAVPPRWPAITLVLAMRCLCLAKGAALCRSALILRRPRVPGPALATFGHP